MRRLCRFFIFACCLLCAPLYAAERIIAFNSDISILEDRTIDVTERITVMAEHREIRRGIYRDLPNSYLHPRWGKFGIKEKTHFTILSIKLDGLTAPWHQIALPNGIRTYIGDKNRLLSRGEHTFEIHYQSTGQISQFEGKDVLNWNVNGQDWVFPTDKISATVTLPHGLRALFYDAFTGQTGSTEKAVDITAINDGSLQFISNKPFAAYEGMTLSLALPEGSVSAPDTGLARLIKDNWKWLLGLSLLFLLPIYYLRTWLQYGRDPNKGVVVADYHPVRDLSPAAHRFITQNKSDDAAFSVSLLNLAVKGYLTIEQKNKKTYTLHKTNKASLKSKRSDLSPGEALIYSGLFKDSKRITLGKAYQPQVAVVKKRLGKYLKQEWRDKIYQKNSVYSWLGLSIGVIALAFCGLHLTNAQIKVGHLLPILIFLFAGLGFTQRSSKSSLFAISGFMVYAGLQNNAFSLFNSQIMIWLSLFVFALFALFYFLLKAPTPFGQKMLDEIEGFRLYLGTAEQNRLEVLHPPEKTPELFEKLLPYAVALGVESQWSKQFTDVFKRLGDEGQAYSPRWYAGNHSGHFSANNIGRALGAGLASSVAAASIAPSASSSGGFSGGAGGGGGGGGGGGW